MSSALQAWCRLLWNRRAELYWMPSCPCLDTRRSRAVFASVLAQQNFASTAPVGAVQCLPSEASVTGM